MSSPDLASRIGPRAKPSNIYSIKNTSPSLLDRISPPGIITENANTNTYGRLSYGGSPTPVRTRPPAEHVPLLDRIATRVEEVCMLLKFLICCSYRRRSRSSQWRKTRHRCSRLNGQHIQPLLCNKSSQSTNQPYLILSCWIRYLHHANPHDHIIRQ